MSYQFPLHFRRQGLSGIYATFFGQNGSQKLSLDRLQRFLNRLHLELVHLEFSFYDENKTVRSQLLQHDHISRDTCAFKL